jgi:hypothetical protein
LELAINLAMFLWTLDDSLGLEKMSRLRRAFWPIEQFLPTFLLGLFLLSLCFVIQRGFPQAIGGLSPRRASLDLLPEVMASQTLAALGDSAIEENGGAAPRVVRSREVLVYYAGDRALIVKRDVSNPVWNYSVYADLSDQALERQRIEAQPAFEIKREAIAAVIWTPVGASRDSSNGTVVQSQRAGRRVVVTR